MSFKTTSLLAALAAGSLLLAACSSVEDQQASNSTAASAAPSSSAASSAPSAGVSSGASPAASASGGGAAGDALKAILQPAPAFTAPGPAIANVASMKGKTVYYVPATYQVPVFQALGASLTSALQTAGITVQVCDGKSNPANMASCMQQAIDAKASAIVTGSIPQELVSVAYTSAQKAGIPVVNLMTAPAGEGDPKQVAYLTPAYVGLQAMSAGWVIADSAAAAKVLYVEITDTPATILWAEQGALATYAKDCPKCEVTVLKVNTGQIDKLAGLVTSALTKNPAITHVQTEVDFTVQPVVEGLQAANATRVKIAGMDGTLATLQMLKGGKYVASEIGFNADALGWYAADQALRMMSGQPSSVNLAFPYQRMFTTENVGTLSLTPDSEKSGEWYGANDYRDGFRKLWGLA